MKTATRRRAGKNGATGGKPLRSATLFADEVFWLNIAAKLGGGTAAKVLSPLIREPLRRALRDKGVDPDKVWADYLAKHRQ